jgi:hypothetical protein
METDYFVKITFIHSSDEDKIITYKLDIKKHDIRKTLKSQKFQLPECFKLTDNSFIVNKRHLEYQHWHKTYMVLLKAGPKLRQEKQLNQIAERQFIYNKQVTKLTYIVTALTVITTVFTLLSTYFGILDHWGQVLRILRLE